MSTTDPLPSKKPSWIRFFLHRMGHYYHWLVIVSAPLYILSVLISSSVLARIVAVQIVLLAVSAFGDMKHEGSMCDQCVAEMPANASDLAERRAKVLRHWHTGRGAKAILIGSAILLTGLAVTVFADSTAGLGLIVIQLYLAYRSYVTVVHRRLSLVCPWCRGGGGWYEDQPSSPKLPTTSA